MGKKVFFILICICLLGLTGCGSNDTTKNKKSLAELVYENTKDTFDQFENKEITTEELTNKLTETFNEYCNNSDEKSCTLLNSAISTSQTQPKELQDCSISSDASMKDLCEATNDSIEYQNKNLETTIRSQMHSISAQLSRLASESNE